MTQVRRKIEQRGEHETPLMHAGVGDFEARRLDGEPAVEQDIDVDGARSFGRAGALAAQWNFQLLQAAEKEEREEVGLSLYDQVKKGALLFEIDRLGFIHRRNALDTQIGRVEAIDRGLEHLFAIANVCAERQVDDLHHKVGWLERKRRGILK